MSRAPVCALALLLAGCHANLRPWDPTPLPARAAWTTEGGHALDLDERGALVVGWAAGDVEAALGVDLAAVESGARVVAIRPAPPVADDDDGSPEALERRARVAVHLAVDDVIVHAIPLAPWLGPIPPAPPLRRAPTAPLPDAPGLLGVPVRSPDDLRGLACGLDLVLDLVVRRGDALLVVRQALRRPEPVATAPWGQAVARGLGCDAVLLDDWPAARRPRGAEPGDVLVTGVAAGSPAARAGLRPLDLLRGERGALDLRTGAAPLPSHLAEQRDAALEDDPALRITRVARPDGTTAEVLLPTPLRAPHDGGAPLLWTWEDDGARWRLGIGPFDWLFHASGRTDYDALSDTHARTTRWSVLTVLQRQSIEGGSGSGGQVRVDPLLDEARLRHLAERMSDRP